MTLGLLADLHMGFKDHGDRWCTRGLEKLKLALNEMADCDYIINFGDLLDGDADVSASEELLRQLHDMMDAYPMIHLIGNHDAFRLQKACFMSVIDPEVGAVSRVDTSEGSILVLDGNFSADGTPYHAVPGDWKDAICPPKQLAWLKAQLADCEQAIVCCHQTMISPDDGDQQERHDGHMLINAKEVREIIERSGKVKGVLCGHRHYGGIGLYHGILYYTQSSMSLYDTVPYTKLTWRDGELFLAPGMKKLEH